MSSWKAPIRSLLGAFGLELRRRQPTVRPLLGELLELYEVDCVFDVGANVGQSGLLFRGIGYSGQLVSFEPVSFLFEELSARAAADSAWTVERLALGDVSGDLEIHVSGGHAGASSLLHMTENVRRNAPDQRVVDNELVRVEALNAMLKKHYPEGHRCFVKLDVQGYELMVLKGGAEELKRVVGLKVELSLVENYSGEMLLTEMLPFLYSLGYRLVQFENGWGNATTREIYQVDAIMFRTDVLERGA